MHGAKHVRIVLDERTRAHQPQHGTRGLVAQTGPELAEAHRQLTQGARALIEDLHMAGAAHRLERHVAIAIVHREHIGTEFLPVAASFPQRPR